MNLYEAATLAREELRRHGPPGWTFAFDHARRRFGCCNYSKKQITLSRPLTLLNDLESVRDTLRHEIAHALTPGANHGPAWRTMCQRLGATPRRCYDEQSVNCPPPRPGRYQMSCSHCGWSVTRRRRTSRKLICKTCRAAVIVVSKQQG